MGCYSLKSTAASLPGKHACPPGLKFVLYGWPDYILYKTSKKPPNSTKKKKKNYQQACKYFHIFHLLVLHKQQNFVFLSAMCIFNQLFIIPVSENIAWKKRGCKETLFFIDGEIHYQMWFTGLVSLVHQEGHFKTLQICFHISLDQIGH